MDATTLDGLEVLGNRIRMEIIIALYKSDDMSAVDFATAFEMSVPAVMKHLHLLEQCGLITRKKVGRRNICSLSKEMLHGIAAWPEMLEVSWLDMLTLEGL